MQQPSHPAATHRSEAVSRCACAQLPFTGRSSLISRVLVCCHCACSRGAAAFLDAEAAVSGSDGSGDEGGSEAAGSLADFVVEPTAEDFEQAGLTFHSSDDEGDPTAVLRERRPFRRFRRQEAAAAAPVLPAGIAALAARRDAVPGGSFLLLLQGCPWLPDTALLCDPAVSDALWAKVKAGYREEKARRQAKPLQEEEEFGLLELPACVDYCAHILAVRLGLLWDGESATPGEKVVGTLMRPHSQHSAACELVTAHEKPLDLSTLLLSVVLEHPGNQRWRNLIMGRQLHKASVLPSLVQGKVSARTAQRTPGCAQFVCSLSPPVVFAVCCSLHPVSCPRTARTGSWSPTRTWCSTSAPARPRR